MEFHAYVYPFLVVVPHDNALLNGANVTDQAMLLH